ncbi:MAG: energy-coupling factor ABC transporter permease [Bacteroidota bacterium]
MHMADALVSPAAGGAMWAASLGAVAYSAHKVRQDLDERKVPLMGVLGAFVFAAQMINFSIPGTGSSGHLGGGLLLAILLGPFAGFLTMASILTVQALFFADGGLLALGCNIFNLGFFTCFITYPLIFKPFWRKSDSPKALLTGTILAAILGLQFGAFGVVLETICSGLATLPFKTFILLMQSIHLAIGLVEGLVTAAVIIFIRQARPEILACAAAGKSIGKINLKRVLIGLAAATAILGGALSWFASAYPDGLEWSLFHATGKEELATEIRLHQTLARVQERTAFLPDYGFRKTVNAAKERPAAAEAVRPAVDGGTSLAGIIGGLMTLIFAGGLGILLWFTKKRLPQ